MLRHLSIEDYGLIERAEIDFSEAATIFTGETGSGKTMVVGAVAFVLGERASAEAVRRGCERAVISLRFDAPKPLAEMFAQQGMELDAGEDCIIVREINAAGKSVVRVNGRQTTAAFVRDIAAYVADIVGQHEAQRLLSPAYHLNLLDRFGGPQLLQQRAEVERLHGAVAGLRLQLDAHSQAEQRARAEFDFARFAADEIERAAPQPGEEETLEQRRRYLENIERITNALQSTHDALTGERASAADALGAASVALSPVSSIDRNLEEMTEAVMEMQEGINELSARIARQLADTEFDAAELERMTERLDELQLLKRKYGGSLETVLEAAKRYREQTDDFASRDERRAALSAQCATQTEALRHAAQALSGLRESAAQKLQKAVEGELPDLALGAGRFRIELRGLAQPEPFGFETAEFVFSANPGEQLRPLARIASGGELSRLLLVLVVVLADRSEQTALIFDEIDAGIGGATATAVGARLGRLAATRQVLAVTHLAQIASWAERHYVLEKRETARRAIIEVRLAERDAQRADELARMLSGEPKGVALRHAHELLAKARR